ncbi:RHS repeat-associated core domain-containing protein [Brevibacillus ruminantium]|uniref:RHS repeat-associated core domain-containing protein n=1 Tax=Brevibacillus ruminantium TaxID=2950604 RepID=UPI0038991B1D
MECKYRNALKYTPRSASNETTGATASYTYHPDGLRATRTAGGKETRYVYLNGKVIEELDKNNQLQARNIWGNELLFRKDTAANKQGYYLYNSHGDVVKIVGEQGEELNRYEYDTWGNIVSKTEGMSNPFAYSGEMFDNETGFYYLRARYYDPTVGRFISEDTYKGQVDNPLSLNRYTYVHNNPLRFVDPSGRKAAEGAGGYFGGSYEDLMLYWAEKAAAYANANNIADYGDAVDIVVPTEHRAEVKTIVYQNGSVKAWEMAGDLPGLGLGAAGAGAVAGIGAIKNTSKNVTNGTVKQSTVSITPSSVSGRGDHLRRTFNIEGRSVRINSGHGYNRSHRTGSVQGIGTMNEIEGNILSDLRSLIKSNTSLPSKNTLQRTVTVNGKHVGYDVMQLKDGTISISTYYPK